jgi:hypothetical protein
MPENRTKTGQFKKGQSGNPGGRPTLPIQIKNYAKEAPDRLRAIADDPTTPVKVRADIEKWFAEMYYGKASQQLAVDAEVISTGTTKVKFEGEIEEWAK